MALVTDLSSETRIVNDDDFGEDRISELPDEILLHILSNLGVRDVAATFALSTRWKSLSRFYPLVYLNFDFETCNLHDQIDVQDSEDRGIIDIWLDSIQKEVEKVAHSARLRFRLHFPVHYSDIKTKAMVMSLLSNAVRHKVEVMELDFSSYYGDGNPVLSLPDTLLTCKSLTWLKLAISFRFEFDDFISLPCLRTLHVNRISYGKGHYVLQLIYSCPVLEELLLQFWGALHYSSTKQFGFNITIPTLLRLTVIDDNPTALAISLRIESPMLQSLKVSGHDIDLVPCNLPSLAKADLNIMPVNRPPASDVLELFGTFCHVKSLKLSFSTFEFISILKSNVDLLPTFYNLTHLEVNDDYSFSYKQGLMHILQKSPNLQSLHYFEECTYSVHYDEEKLLFKSSAIPLCLKHCLKTFTFRGRDVNVFLLRYILENAQVLEHFTFHWLCELPVERKMLAEEDLSTLFPSDCLYEFIEFVS